MPNNPLRDRWLTAMRRSTTRAIGRECDYAASEGDVDKYDPLGLLALLAESEYLTYFVSYPGEDGARVPHGLATALAVSVGFNPDKLYELALGSDYGASWEELAFFVEMHCRG